MLASLRLFCLKHVSVTTLFEFSWFSLVSGAGDCMAAAFFFGGWCENCSVLERRDALCVRMRMSRAVSVSAPRMAKARRLARLPARATTGRRPMDLAAGRHSLVQMPFMRLCCCSAIHAIMLLLGVSEWLDSLARITGASRASSSMSAAPPPSRPFHYGGKSFATPYFIQYAASGRSKVRCQPQPRVFRPLNPLVDALFAVPELQAIDSRTDTSSWQDQTASVLLVSLAMLSPANHIARCRRAGRR